MLSVGKCTVLPWPELRGLRVLVCYSWSRRVSWQGCSGPFVPLTKTPPCPWATLSHQNYCQVAVLLKKFALCRISSIRLQKDFLKKKSQSAIVTVLNSVEPSWSLLLVELARGVVEERACSIPNPLSKDCLAPVCRATNFCSWNPFIAWVLLINYLSPGLLKIW